MKKITFLTITFALLSFTWQANAQYGCDSGVSITDGYTATGITSSGTGGAEDWNNPNPSMINMCENSAGNSLSPSYFDDDVYLFTYTAGANDEEVSMTITSNTTWTGIAIFASCSGTALDDCLGSSGSSGGGTLTATANISAGQTVYIGIGQWGTPNAVNFDVDAFSATPLVNPPSCTTLSSPMDMDVDVLETTNLTWNAATGGPTGYMLSVGTTTGGTDIVNNEDVGLTTSYDLPILTFSQIYYVTIVPYNGNGNASGCAEESFTVRDMPPLGDACSAPIVGAVETDCSTATPTSLDFDAGGTETLPNCDTSGNNGYWVELTAPANGTININLAGTATGVGLVIYDSCGGTEVFCNNNSLGAVTEISGLTGSATYYMYFWQDTASGVAEVCFEEVSCIMPTALEVSNITSTSAVLGWVSGGSETLWDIELVDITASGTATGTPTASGVSNPYSQMSLVENNDYEFYVRADCGGSTSDWAGPFSFSTLCATVMAPYTEDFENGGVIPDCWSDEGAEDWQYDDDGGDHVGNGGTITGSTTSGGFYAYADASGTQADAILVSPFVDISGLTTPALSFYLISDSEDSDNSQLDVEVWDGAAWNNLGTYNSNTSGWELKVLELTGLTITGDVQAKFIFTEPTSGDFDDDIAIDDVSFDEAPSCIAPSNLSASNVTDAAADLGWSAGGSETLWDIEIVDVTASGTPTGTPTASGVSNPYSAMGLTPNNEYEFYVRADCGGGELSDWTGPFAFTTECSVFVPDYLESFDVSVAPDCWLEAGSGDPSTGPSDLGSGLWNHDEFTNIGSTNNSAQINLYTNNREDWLISPSFDLSGGSYELVYTVALTDFANSNPPEGNGMGVDDEVQVLISDDAGATWTNLTTYNQSSFPSETGDIETFDLSAYTGTVQFAIWATDGAVNDPEDYDFFVDEFMVRTPLACTSAVVDSSTIDEDCNNIQFYVDVDITTVGDATQINDGTNTYPIAGTGVVQVGPFAEGTTANLTVEHSDPSCNFSLGDFTFNCPPSNDDCFNATSLTPGAVFEDNPVDGTVLGATADAEPAACGLDGPGIWYSIVVPPSGEITILTGDDSLGGTGFDSVIEAFTGSCGSLVSIGCDDDGAPGFSDAYSQLELTGLTGGETIYVRVWEYGGNDTEPFAISAFDASLSDNEFESESAFTYYPNPVKNTLTLNAQNTIEDVTMYNMLGQEVLRAAPNNVDSELDMSGLEAGTYFVRVTIASITKTVRVIKQ